MLSVSTMSLAAMLGSGCGTNMANVNTYIPCQYNQPNCPKNVRIQKSGQNLDSILAQMGVCAPDGNSQCGINPNCKGGNCQTNTCQGSSCSTGSCKNGVGIVVKY